MAQILQFTKKKDVWVSSTLTSTGTPVTVQVVTGNRSVISIKARIGTMDFDTVASFNIDNSLPITDIDMRSGVEFYIESTAEPTKAEYEQ